MDNFDRLQSLPDGIIVDTTSPFHRILLRKELSQIIMYFADIADPTLKLSGIMSRIDIDNPVHLLGVYMQVMMLTLLWAPFPKRVYTLGFGGGRIPFVLRHYFPDIFCESTDIDPEIPNIATKFFGITFDAQQKLVLQDGRTYLENQPKNVQYDIIMLDAFQGAGYTAYQLGTIEFYALCKNHLSEQGVVALNIVDSDPLFSERLHTFAASFSGSYIYADEHAYVLFGTMESPIREEELQKRARHLTRRIPFTFPFLDRAKQLQSVVKNHNGRLLHDR